MRFNQSRAFAGTADAYLQYRPAYPDDLIADLVHRASAPVRDGLLVDLACGPGRLTLALAPFFKRISAVDAEPEMIAAARTEAVRRGVSNVDWIVGRAEDLEIAPHTATFLTVGEAFHRLDQVEVARSARRWLAPGGGVAIAGCHYGILNGIGPWQAEVASVVQRWRKRHPGPERAGLGAAHSGPARDEEVLRAAGFSEVASHEFVQVREWTVDDVVGFLASTSICSVQTLGSDAAAFAADVRSALLAHDAAGCFREQLRFGYTFGRQPVCSSGMA